MVKTPFKMARTRKTPKKIDEKPKIPKKMGSILNLNPFVPYSNPPAGAAAVAFLRETVLKRFKQFSAKLAKAHNK